MPASKKSTSAKSRAKRATKTTAAATPAPAPEPVVVAPPEPAPEPLRIPQVEEVTLDQFRISHRIQGIPYLLLLSPPMFADPRTSPAFRPNRKNASAVSGVYARLPWFCQACLISDFASSLESPRN